MDKPYFLMTAKEKERARKRMIKQAQRGLTKQEKNLDKYQNKILKTAQKAQEQGSATEFTMAKKTLENIIKYKRYIQAFSLRIDVLDVICSTASVTGNTVKVMSKISKETIKIAEKMDIEASMENMEEAMDQMNDLFQEMDEMLQIGTNGSSDPEIESQITRMVEETRMAQQGSVDAEINDLLSKNGLKISSM